MLTAALAEPRVASLATRADLEVFGPTEPTPADVEAFWTQVDEIVGGMGKERSLWQRLRARLSIRSLLEGTRFALPARLTPPPRAAKPAAQGTAAEPVVSDAAPSKRASRRAGRRRAAEPTHPPQETE